MRDLIKLPTFVDKHAFHVVVESPRGSPIKLKYDPDLGAMSLSRPLVLGITHPHDSGFLQFRSRPRRFGVKNVHALPRRLRDELAHFFIAPTALEGKDPKIIGWGGLEAAMSLIRNSRIARPS